MAGAYGQRTGKAGAWTATPGPDSANPITDIADAWLDRAPRLVIAGRGAPCRLHQESRLIVPLARLLGSVSEYAARINESLDVGGIDPDALARACEQVPGPALVSLPERIAAEEVQGSKAIFPSLAASTHGPFRDPRTGSGRASPPRSGRSGPGDG